MIIKFNVESQIITRIDNNAPVSDSVNYIDFEFAFSDDWNGINKTAVISLGNGTPYYVLIVDDKISAENLPIFTQGEWKISVFGGDLQASNTAPLYFVASGLKNGKTPVPSTPDAYTAILDLALDANEKSTSVRNELDTYAEVSEQVENNAINARTSETNAKHSEEISVSIAEQIVTDEAARVENENARILAETERNNNFVSETTALITQKSGEIDQAKDAKIAEIDIEFQTKYDGLDAEYAIKLNSKATLTELQAVASGAPKAVATVAEMTDHTKNYVYTGIEEGYTSGHWYYWNGTMWTSGGIYQSAGIADDSITNEKIASTGISVDKIQQATFTPATVNLFDKTKAVNGVFSTSTGAFTAGDAAADGLTWSCYTSGYIAVTPNANYIKNQPYDGTEVTYWDENKTFVQGNSANSAGLITVPTASTIKYARVTILVSTTDRFDTNHNPINLDDFMVVAGATLPDTYIPFATDVVSITNLDVPQITVIETQIKPRQVIFDTDWATDVDDVVAARVLIWAERMGMVDIVALNCSVANDLTTPSIDAYFQAEGRKGLVLSVDKSATDYAATATYHTKLMAMTKYYENIAAMEDSVDMYRRAYANAKQPIDIICVGFLNGISKFLQSGSDSISSYTGLELMAQNGGVLYCMGGQYPSGSEWNFNQNARAYTAASYVTTHFPNAIYFLGYEVGSTVVTGGNLATVSPKEDDVLTMALYDHGYSGGRYSWDPMLTLFACYGDLGVAGYAGVYGNTVVDGTTGVDSFATNSNGKHCYVVKAKTDNWYVRQINTILERSSWGYRKVGINQLPRL